MPRSAPTSRLLTSRPIVAPNGVEWLVVPAWEGIPWLRHGFSTRRGGRSQAYASPGTPGELNLGFTTEDDRENVLQNRELLAEAVSGDRRTPIVTVRQIHSARHVIVEHAEPAAPACEGDGIMTTQPGILLGIQTADCVPVLVADRRGKVVAAFHAGWRGTVKRIVEDGISRMRQDFGCRPEDMVAAIGPAIGPCCYTVGTEVLSEFQTQFQYFEDLFHATHPIEAVSTSLVDSSTPDQGPAVPLLHLDLFEANRRQLLAAGLAPESIQCVGGCTACQPHLFFSHRASRGRAGRMLSVIGIRPD